MRLEEIMCKHVITVTPDTTIEEALALVRSERIRHLPVVERGRLVGIVSDRDLRDALPSVLARHDDDPEVLAQPVSTVMTLNVITAHPLDFVEEAAKTIYEHRVGSLPVVEDGRLVGIVTQSDILNKLIELFGVHHPSSVIEVEVDDQVGMLAEVSQVFREAQVNVACVIVQPSPDPGKKILGFRVRTIDPRPVVRQLTANGFAVLDPGEGGRRS